VPGFQPLHLQKVKTWFFKVCFSKFNLCHYGSGYRREGAGANKLHKRTDFITYMGFTAYLAGRAYNRPLLKALSQLLFTSKI
jgi:hypothetical protein